MTDRQRRFVEEYLVDLNATQAAVRAGYSEKTANREGSRLLSHVDIQAALSAAVEARSRRTAITADYVLQRLKEEAELTGEGASHSARVAALKLLGQHLALFVEKREVSGTVKHEHEAARLEEFRRRYGTAGPDASEPAGADGGAQPVRPGPAHPAAD